MRHKEIESGGTVYSFEPFPLHLIIYWNNRTNVIILECDYDKKRFIDSTIYKNFCCNNRSYDRRKPRNHRKYINMKASIPYDVYKAAIEYIFD